MPSESRRPATALAIGGSLGIVAVIAMAMIIRYGYDRDPLKIDTAWLKLLEGFRTPWLEWPSYVLNVLGGTLAAFAFTIAAVVILLLLRRVWAAIFIGVSVGIAASIATILKSIGGRPRPEEILVHAASGAFPSGHTNATAALVVALALLIRRTWAWAAGVVLIVAMAFSRNYLYAHWLTDVLGGAILGASVTLLFWAVLHTRINKLRQ